MTLDANGFSRPTLVEVKSDLDQTFTDALGDINTEPDSATGQLIGVLAEAFDNFYQELQDVYDAMYPATAEGTSLDGAVSLVGLTRLAAEKTTVAAVVYGAEGSIVPTGTLAHTTDNNYFTADSDTVVSRSNSLDVTVQVTTVTNSAPYQVIVNGASYIITSDSSATAEEIAQALGSLSIPAVTASYSGQTARFKSSTGVNAFTFTADSKLTITKLGSLVNFTANEFGATVVPANTLTSLDNSLSGVDSIGNLSAGVIGRNVESDDELRLRHAQSVRVSGAATAPAIKARLLSEVDGVNYVAIYENRSNTVDSFGLPPHSFVTVVRGGTDAAVAAKLYEVKPAAVNTFGTTSVYVNDVNGDDTLISFSRPAIVPVFMRVTVLATDPEQVLDPEYVAAIKQAVVDYGSTISIGRDVITQRFYGPIYDNVQGMGKIKVEVSLAPPAWTEDNIVIVRDQQPTFDLANVTVVG